MIDVLTLNYNDSASTIQFISSIKEIDCIEHIVVVDNKSTDSSWEELHRMVGEKIYVIQSGENGGYGAGNNFGIEYLKKHFHSKKILLANPDVIICKDVLEKMEKFMDEHSEYAFVAPLMCSPKGIVQYNSAMKIPGKLMFVAGLDMFVSKFLKPFYYKSLFSKNGILDVDAVAGSLFLMDVESMSRYGMFDENIFLYCEEIVLGLKMKKAGLKTALLTNLNYVHNHSVSIQKSYSSLLARNKLIVKSFLYVLQTYYKIGKFSYLIAQMFAKIRLLEIRFIGIFKKYR